MSRPPCLNTGCRQGASKEKRRRILEAAEAKAEEVAQLQETRDKANEIRVNPDDLKCEQRGGEDSLVVVCTVHWTCCMMACYDFRCPSQVGRSGDRTRRNGWRVSWPAERAERSSARPGRKKQKSGGLTEREKQKRKAMPMAARVHQVQVRSETARKLKMCKKNLKGHT